MLTTTTWTKTDRPAFSITFPHGIFAMSLTMQVLATRNISLTSVLDTVPELRGVEPHEEHGWIWFVISAWEIEADRLLEALDVLPGTTMLASLHDYQCWTLRLQGEGKLPFAMCYEFGRLLLDDEADDEPDFDMPTPPDEPMGKPVAVDESFFTPAWQAKQEVKQFGLDAFLALPARLGMPVPDDVVEELRQEKPSEFIDAFQEWVTDGILDALEEYEIPHDPDEIDAILLGDDVSDGELERPEGNFPRFLLALDITQGWAEWLEQAASDDEEDLDEIGEARALREDLDHILKHSAKGLPEPLDGGPVQLLLDDMDLLVRVGWFCSHMVGAAVGFELPAGAKLDDFPFALDWTPKGGGARTPLYPGDFLEFGEDRETIVYALRALPDGAVITIWFGDETYAVARQIYTGKRVGESWHIEASAPPVTNAVLTEALELARAVQRKKATLQVRSEAEFQQACEISLSTGNVEEGLPTLDGLMVKGSLESRIEMAVALFRLRFTSQWDTAAVQKDEMREAEGYFEELDRIFGKMAVPYKPAVLFEGEGRRYHEADVDRMDFDGKRERAVEALHRCAAMVRSAGYVSVGDLYSTGHPFEFMRFYLPPDRRSLLIETVSQLGAVCRDLYTEFEGDAALVTTSSFRRNSLPHRGLLVHTVDDPAMATMGAAHEEGLRRMAATCGAPKSFGATLPELARDIERLLFRMEGAGTMPEVESPSRPGRR